MQPLLRDTSIEVIKNMPKGSTLEEIMYEINLTAQVLKGIENENNGEVIATSELLKKVNQWKTK